MDAYIRFKAGVTALESGVDYKKGDTNSRKRAIKALLNDIGASDYDAQWMYRTEFKK